MAKSERNLEQVIVALTALQSYARDLEPEYVVRDYHDLLGQMDALGHEVPPGLRVPDEDLKHINYSTDAYGNITGQSDVRYIDQPRLLVRLEPALDFARAQLVNQAPVDVDSSSNRPTASDAGKLSVERRRPRWEGVTTFEELDLMRREIRSLDESIDIITIPTPARGRLSKWARAVEGGLLTAEDWQQMKEDFEDLGSHIGENVDRDPDDYDSIAVAHQSLQFAPKAITSTMREVEARETTKLDKVLAAYGQRQQRRHVRAAELEAVGGMAIAAMPPKIATATNAEPLVEVTPVVFIGHGHSPLWRELKDYIEDDLHLTTNYFEQDSRVGKHMAEILAGFLDQATCTIIVLTADDEQEDGRERARQNVVHEVAYFQGKLGFKRVAMVIQEGVEEFTNVNGIVPIRFPDRHIKQAFPELQRWLKREKLLS